MDQNVRVQRVNLAAFIRGFLLPGDSRLQAAERRYRRYAETQKPGALLETRERVVDPANVELWQALGVPLVYNQCNSWEAYFWLQLGNELGCFPRPESVQLLGKTLRPSAEFRKHFEHLYSASLQLLMPEAVRGGIPEKTRYEGFQSPNSLRAPFQMALMIESSYADSAITQAFTIGTSFMVQRMWEDLTASSEWDSGDFSEDELRMAFDTDLGETVQIRREHLLIGFAQAMKCIGSFVEFFEALRASGDVGERDLGLFERRVKEICFWRLNFLAGNAKARIEGLTKLLASAVFSERSRQQLVSNWEPSAPEFQRRVNELMTSWTHGVRLWLEATA